MFHIGDQVVYPMHGAGFIEGTLQQTIGGQQREYYDIRIHGGSIRLKLPVTGAGTDRLRPVMEKEQAKKLFNYFTDLEIDTNAPWGKRYKENIDHLKTGIPEEVAEVVKTLMLRDKTVGLSTGDRQVMVTAKNILCSELSLALNVSLQDVQNNLQEIVDQTLS